MSWAVGFDPNWRRDIGYGVPAVCDHPECDVAIDRGLSYVCGSDPFGGEQGCGLFFCSSHLCYINDGRTAQLCDRCADGERPFTPKPDESEWIHHKLTNPSWEQWRTENPAEVEALT